MKHTCCIVWKDAGLYETPAYWLNSKKSLWKCENSGIKWRRGSEECVKALVVR